MVYNYLKDEKGNVEMTLNLDSFTKEQIKQLLPTFIRLAGVEDTELLTNKFFIETMKEKPRNDTFRILSKYIELFGYEKYVEELNTYEIELKKEEKKKFMNMLIEPRYQRKNTTHVFEERRKALQMYHEKPEEFSIELHFEPENPYDDNAIAVYGVGKKHEYQIGYISRDFNLEIGKRLLEDPFPFIQSNIKTISHQEELFKLDIFF